MADVVRFACGDNEPEVIGRRRYNAAQAAIGSSAPSAQGLVKRFGMPLSRVIDMALEPAETRMVLIAGDGSQLVATDLPTELMLKAVRAAQLQLGTTPGAFEYDNWVERHIATRRRSGLLAYQLPRSVTIISRLGSWETALRDAGILTPEDAAPNWRADRAAAPSAVETLDRCIEETGVLPARAYFIKWCRRRDIPVGRELLEWSALVDAVRLARTDRGASTPARATMTRKSPPLPDEEECADRRRALRDYWTRERCLEALRRYRDTYLRGKPARQRHYRDCAKRDSKLPSCSTLQRHGKFQDLCREAGL